MHSMDVRRARKRLLSDAVTTGRTVSATRWRGKEPSGASTDSARRRIRRARWSSSAPDRCTGWLTANNFLGNVQAYVTVSNPLFNNPTNTFSSNPRVLQLAVKFHW